MPDNPEASSSSSRPAAVPCSIVTGFLGSGKTTLLRHVLTAPHGLRVAVIQNELSAATGLEADTMVGPDGETFAKWLELANGCVCCEVRDELAKGIETLLELKGGFDYVLVETTGMADPGPVAESFWLDAELEGRLYLDGVVCVVDCENFDSEAVGGSMEACRQVGCADVIIFNKAAGGGEGEGEGVSTSAARRHRRRRQALRRHVRSLNPHTAPRDDLQPRRRPSHPPPRRLP